MIPILYGYIRVSSTDQSEDRQPKALRNAGDDRTHSFGVQVGHAPPEPPQNPAEGDPPVTSGRSGGGGTDGSVGTCSGGADGRPEKELGAFGPCNTIPSDGTAHARIDSGDYQPMKTEGCVLRYDGSE